MTDAEAYARLKDIRAKMKARGMRPRGGEFLLVEHSDGSATVARLIGA